MDPAEVAKIEFEAKEKVKPAWSPAGRTSWIGCRQGRARCNARSAVQKNGGASARRKKEVSGGVRYSRRAAVACVVRGCRPRCRPIGDAYMILISPRLPHEV